MDNVHRFYPLLFLWKEVNLEVFMCMLVFYVDLFSKNKNYQEDAVLCKKYICMSVCRYMLMKPILL